VIHFVPALLGLGACATIWLASLAGARQLLIAQMMAGVWMTGITLWHLNLLWLLPLFDLAIGAMAMRYWLGGAESWSLSIAFLTIYRLAAHVIDWLTHSAFFVGYAHALNALFALQLIIIASTGGADGRHRLIHWFRRLRSVGGLGPSRAQGMSSAR
jgi:hypothetical protein